MVQIMATIRKFIMHTLPRVKSFSCSDINMNTSLPTLRWVQCMELDHRFESGKCFFLSTSEGGIMHIDLRTRPKVTFDQVLSEKKINTVR